MAKQRVECKNSWNSETELTLFFFIKNSRVCLPESIVKEASKLHLENSTGSYRDFWVISLKYVQLKILLGRFGFLFTIHQIPQGKGELCRD